MFIDLEQTPPRRFSGTERLYGRDAWHKLTQAHVCVVGVGGVGSWAVEALARSGIGKLTLIDLDNVAESNTNRQIQALSDQFGRAKVEALQARIFGINPNCQVHTIEDFITCDNINEHFSQQYSFVIDAIDQVRVKAAMADHFVRHRQAFIVSGSAGGQRHLAPIAQADLARVTHDPLLANLRYTLRRHYGHSRNPKDKLQVACIYSSENIQAPKTDACDTAPQGLSCAGYGSSMLVTASFGLHCAHAAIEHILTAKAT